MPEAVLSSVVFLIGIELVDAKGMRQIYAQRPVEFWVALLTALVVIFVGVEQGILLAIALSILIHIRHGYKPKNAVLEVDNTGRPHMVPVSSHAQAIPGLMVYRFHHSMYYANAEHFYSGSARAGEHAQTRLYPGSASMPPRWMISIFSAAATLRETYNTVEGERHPAGDGRGRRRCPPRAGPALRLPI